MIQRGPKPTEFVTIETRQALLVGEKIGGKWKWECDEDREFARRFNGAVSPDGAIKLFMKRYFDA